MALGNIEKRRINSLWSWNRMQTPWDARSSQW